MVMVSVCLSGAWPMLYSSVFCFFSKVRCWHMFTLIMTRSRKHNCLQLTVMFSVIHWSLSHRFIAFFVPVWFWSWDLTVAARQDTATRPSLTPPYPAPPLRVRPRNTTPRYVDVTPGFLIKPTLALPAVNKHSWQRPTGSSSCAAITEECHEPVSKEHTFILDIKHLAADPARVTQWAKEKSLLHK